MKAKLLIVAAIAGCATVAALIVTTNAGLPIVGVTSFRLSFSSGFTVRLLITDTDGDRMWTASPRQPKPRLIWFADDSPTRIRLAPEAKANVGLDKR